MNWKTKEGKILKISEMTDSHLENSIVYKRKNWSGNAFDKVGGEIVALENEKQKRIRKRFFGQKSKCECGGELYIADCSEQKIEVGMSFSWPKYAWKCRDCPFTSCEIQIPAKL